MSIQSRFVRSLVTAAALTVPGLAFAHSPPSLVKAQADQTRAAACGTATPSPAYRNTFVRFGMRSPSSATRGGDGYRASFARFGGRRPTRSVACVPERQPRLASR